MHKLMGENSVFPPVLQRKPPCFPVLPCQSESHCSEEREAGGRAAREVSNCGLGSRPATQPPSLSNHLRLVLIRLFSLVLYLHGTLGLKLDQSFGLGRESEIDGVNADGFQSLGDVERGEKTGE
ncbi:hypothetical protein Q8A67_018147 [Cirrhinus molitorella]|uniref:Uncharacterized protein n=1 Tax=Cirrhinus molitorella TaxID=172907 RepID=A0AA88PFI9_9TELE|nr:hypothetical protein Q8A67_018147 [Cirrhinus molitorella]